MLLLSNPICAAIATLRARLSYFCHWYDEAAEKLHDPGDCPEHADAVKIVYGNNLRRSWLNACDAAVDLQHAADCHVVIAGNGEIIFGYQRPCLIQMIDDCDNVLAVIEIQEGVTQ